MLQVIILQVVRVLFHRSYQVSDVLYKLTQSAGVVNTPTAPLQRGETPHLPTSVLDMTLNNLKVRFQQCWSFGEIV